MLKWVCWECGAKNPYHPAKAVQDKCPKCGGELKIGRAPLASTTHIAGFVLMAGGVFWGFDELVPEPLSYPTFALLAILFALAVGAGMVALGLYFYNRAAHDHLQDWE